MRILLAGWAVGALALTLAGAAAAADTPRGLHARETEEGVQISDGDTPVLFYQRKVKSLDGAYARSNYVHPLCDLEGRTITEDFPKDHPHHRGVFWGWHQWSVGERELGDSWALKDFVWDIREVKPEPGEDGSLALLTRVFWQSPAWKSSEGDLLPLVEESAVIRVFSAVQGARQIDFTIRLRALVPNVHIGGSADDKGYGGFSPRIRCPQDLTFQGEAGEVVPQRTAVEAGRWLNLTGSLAGDEQKSGVAILCHPSLPVFPPPWVLRRRFSMQNVVFPGEKPVLLPTDEPLTLRYRLVIHRGDADAETLQRWQREFEADDRATNGKRKN